MFVVTVIWVPLYTHYALRRTYGGSNGITMLKEMGIGALYTAAYVPSVVTLAVWIGGR